MGKKLCLCSRATGRKERKTRARAHLRRRGEKARIEGIVRVGGFHVAESLVPAFERAKGNEFARTAVEERRGGEEDRVGAGTRTTGARETRGRGRLGSKYRKAERGVCRGERLRLEDRGEYQVAVDDPYATAASLMQMSMWLTIAWPASRDRAQLKQDRSTGEQFPPPIRFLPIPHRAWTVILESLVPDGVNLPSRKRNRKNRSEERRETRGSSYYFGWDVLANRSH